MKQVFILEVKMIKFWRFLSVPIVLALLLLFAAAPILLEPLTSIASAQMWEYNLTVEITGQGDVTINGTTPTSYPNSTSYANGTNVTINATPAAGYSFVDWTGGNASNITDPAAANTTILMTGNYSICANFAINTYTITASAGTGGAITPSGAVSVNYGSDETFTITPNAGYDILDVLVDGSSVGAVTSYTFSSVTASHTIAASFTPSALPVAPASLSASGLSISPHQVNPDQDVTISINVANSGGETGSYNAVLYINGAVEDSQSVSVAGGTTKNVIFTVSKSEAGVYDVSLAGQSGQFEVVGGGGWFGGGLGTGGIVAIVVIVIALIVGLVFILRGTRREV
jgi:hypothetical protein